MVLHGWIILLTFALSNRSYMEDRYIIYLHVNKINNKVYVGITKHSNPELRWRCGYKNNSYFNHSIKKYGWDKFDHIVLFRNLPNQYKAGSLHPNYGKSISNIHKDRIKVALSKAVLMIDKSTNEILREFESATDAETFLSKRSHHISSCCNNKRKSAYGYIWRYKNKENCI